MADYLYHYTGIQKLALILKNKNIKFNNLLNVDDPEEAETEDCGLLGRHCLVSCWTDHSTDELPMWNMYTPHMKGVRIGMRKNPFKHYTYGKEMGFPKNIDSFMDYSGEYAKKVCFVAKCPLLLKVEYTDDKELLKPKVKELTENGETFSFEKIGKYKRKYWAFQQEFRYVIRTAPWSMQELEDAATPKDQKNLFDRIEDEKNNSFCNEIYLQLAEDAFDGMEVLLRQNAMNQNI